MTYVHPQDDRFGRKVGGHRYKKWKPPEPLAVKILKLTAVGIAVIMSPPLLINAMKAYLNYKIDEARYYEYIDKKRIQNSLRYLKRKHFIAFPGKGKFTITKTGRARLDRINIDQIIVKRVPWDGKWRLLTFDIPEEKESKRDYFRRRLKEIGFYHFQRSVFIIPYPCRLEINTMCEELDIEANIHLITADSFEGDDELKSFFRLE